MGGEVRGTRAECMGEGFVRESSIGEARKGGNQVPKGKIVHLVVDGRREIDEHDAVEMLALVLCAIVRLVRDLFSMPCKLLLMPTRDARKARHAPPTPTCSNAEAHQ